MTTESTTTPQTTFPIAVGSEIRYRSAPATVISIADPGNPRSPVDLVFADSSLGGQRRIISNVSHGAALGEWITQAEIDACRPLTPLEEVEAARLRGERVPEVGMIAYLARSEGEGIATCLIIRRRMGVTRVHSLTEVDGIVLHNRPEDALDDDPDVPLALHGLVTRSRHASTASDWTKDEYMKGCWSYTDEDLVPEQSGPHRWVDVHPPYMCDSCKSRCSHVFVITISISALAPPKSISVCDSCRSAAAEILNQQLQAPVQFRLMPDFRPPADSVELEAEAERLAQLAACESRISSRVDQLIPL